MKKTGFPFKNDLVTIERSCKSSRRRRLSHTDAPPEAIGLRQNRISLLR